MDEVNIKINENEYSITVKIEGRIYQRVMKKCRGGSCNANNLSGY